MNDQCERCNDRPRKKGDRYCTPCAKQVLAELKASGYLTRAPLTPGAWSGKNRTSEQRENTQETKHGTGHG